MNLHPDRDNSDEAGDGILPRLSRRAVVKLAATGSAIAAMPHRGIAREPRRGGVLRHIGLEPSSFDVHGSVACETQLISSFVRRTLFKFVHGARSAPSDFKLAPDLATRAEPSPDGRLYTITLRRGVRWEQRPPLYGRELTATDAKYSLDRVRQRSPYASLLGPVDGIETAGSHTLRVHLRDGFEPFVQMLAEPWTAIVPFEVEDRFGDFKSAESLVGCGPFVLQRYEPGLKAVFVRNPSYYQGDLPYLDRVDWILLPDRSTQLSLFRAGEVDIPFYDAGIPRAEVPDWKRSNPTYPVVYWEGLATRALAMRTDRPPFSDVRVRRAFSMAVDRTSWVAHYLDGQGFEDSGPVPAPMRQWKLGGAKLAEGARYLAHDPPLARKLLAEAGVPNGLRVKCTYWPGYGQEYVQDLERLTSELRQVGVELSLVGEDSHGYFRSSFAGHYGEATWGPSPLFSEVDGYLYSSYRSGAGANRSHVADPALDAMLDVERRLGSRASRKSVIDEIQRRAAAQVYYVYTPTPKCVAAWTPWIRNYAPKNSLDRGAQLEVVWLDRG